MRARPTCYADDNIASRPSGTSRSAVSCSRPRMRAYPTDANGLCSDGGVAGQDDDPFELGFLMLVIVVERRHLTPQYPRKSTRCRADRRPIWALNNSPGSRLLELPGTLEVCLKCAQEPARVSESSLVCSTHESCQSAFREFRPLFCCERREPSATLSQRVLRHVSDHTGLAHVPRCPRPRSPVQEWGVVTGVITALRHQAPSNPFGHRHRYGVAHEAPTAPPMLVIPQCRRPPRWKSLKTLKRLYGRGNDPTIRQEDRRGRRDAKSRSDLQRRHRVRSQSVPGAALGPVESDRTPHIHYRPVSASRVVGEQHVPRVPIDASHDVNSSTPLRNPKGSTVHHTRGPAIPHTFQTRQQVLHCSPLSEVQHEVHVLHYDPRHTS